LTLLVKNEADIILDNILYHYAMGVDFIIVCDNGSTDGTMDILRALNRDGLVHLSEESGYVQDQLVNKMGDIAKDKYGATILIHADADEFWTPLKGNNLKKTFLGLFERAVLVDRKDVLPAPEKMYQDFPQNRMYIITKPFVRKNVMEASKKQSLFLFWLPPKVMFSIKDQFKNVGFGNHLLSDSDSGTITKAIHIFHFPFKSVARFEEKVIMAGAAIETVPTSKETWWHWKRWFNAYKHGRLEQEINILIPDLSKIRGIKYKPFNYKKKILDEINNNKKTRKLYSKYSGLNRAL
jgi:hypothetical protein